MVLSKTKVGKAALPLHLEILATAVRQEKYVKDTMMKRASVVSPENVHCMLVAT